MKKATLFKAVEKRWSEITTHTSVESQNTWSTTNNTVDTSKPGEKINSNGTVSLWGSTKSSWVNNSNTQTPSETATDSTNVKILPGTTEYFGVLDIVSILWQKPEFTLQDSKGNYFVYYWNHLNFVWTIVALGGNVYEMVTEAEILQNQLFGDRVSYINLSMFKDVRVMMVIEIDGDVWLLQVPASKYHYSKDYLKSLFIQ